ncbi:hemolysin family protein [Thermodesulfobacterium hydrogeniphilum]|uniref:hemolysin family protein n=1 Tax=Thermodesulfobacterium hydrogeniphilum TaxID=161156 RepID=UPI00056F3BED|nr:hemolysin family protein [Thermodesulfobacterium hydrogeniphilum]
MVEFYIVFTLILLFASMIFTVSETSIFSFSRIELAGLRSIGLPEKFLKIFQFPEELLIVLIAGNEIVDYFASFCSSKIFSYWFPNEGKKLAFLIFSFIAFWFGDFFPKVIGFRFKNFLITKLLYIDYFFYQMFYPLRKIYSFLYQFLDKILPKYSYYTRTFSPVEQLILYMLDQAYNQKKITEKEKNFIRGLFLSEKIPVSAIFTPRSEILAFQDQLITLSFLEKLRYLPYNKFPIYKENLDDIIGILYVKDLIKNFSPEILNKKMLSDFIRPAFFIPENFKVRDLLFEFQNKHIKIALVVDEYGILKGLVTLEDVLEELFGEIYEEKEAKIEPIQKLSENKWLVYGKVLMEDLKQVLNIEILEEDLQDIKTLNGFLLALFKEIPKEGNSIIYQDHKFIVKKIKGRKIIWVEIEKLKTKAEE